MASSRPREMAVGSIAVASRPSPSTSTSEGAVAPRPSGDARPRGRGRSAGRRSRPDDAPGSPPSGAGVDARPDARCTRGSRRRGRRVGDRDELRPGACVTAATPQLGEPIGRRAASAPSLDPGRSEVGTGSGASSEAARGRVRGGATIGRRPRGDGRSAAAGCPRWRPRRTSRRRARRPIRVEGRGRSAPRSRRLGVRRRRGRGRRSASGGPRRAPHLAGRPRATRASAGPVRCRRRASCRSTTACQAAASLVGCAGGGVDQQDCRTARSSRPDGSQCATATSSTTRSAAVVRSAGGRADGRGGHRGQRRRCAELEYLTRDEVQAAAPRLGTSVMETMLSPPSGKKSSSTLTVGSRGPRRTVRRAAARRSPAARGRGRPRRSPTAAAPAGPGGPACRSGSAAGRRAPRPLRHQDGGQGRPPPRGGPQETRANPDGHDVRRQVRPGGPVLAGPRRRPRIRAGHERRLDLAQLDAVAPRSSPGGRCGRGTPARRRVASARGRRCGTSAPPARRTGRRRTGRRSAPAGQVAPGQLHPGEVELAGHADGHRPQLARRARARRCSRPGGRSGTPPGTGRRRAAVPPGDVDRRLGRPVQVVQRHAESSAAHAIAASGAQRLAAARRPGAATSAQPGLGDDSGSRRGTPRASTARSAAVVTPAPADQLGAR